MKLSSSFIRLCIESSKICGFQLLSFVETRHVSFMLQAFRLNDTCRCITTAWSSAERWVADTEGKVHKVRAIR